MQSVPISRLASRVQTLVPPAQIEVPATLEWTNIPGTGWDFGRHLLRHLYVPRVCAVAEVALWRFLADTQVVVPNGEEFLPVLGPYVTQEQVRPGWTVEQVSGAAAAAQEEVVVDGSVVLIARYGIRTWGHWLGELLPKAVCLEAAYPGRFRYAFPNDLVADPELANMAESLRAYGITDSRLVLLHPGRRYQFGELLTVSSVWADRIIHPEVVRLMNDLYPAPAADGPTDTKMALLRRESRTRNLRNLQEIEPLLTASGWCLTDPGNLTFAAQVAAFRQATSILSIVGSGLSGLIYSPQGVRVLGLSPVGWADDFFFGIMQIKGAKFADVRGTKSPDDARDVAVSSFSVRAEDILHGLNGLGITDQPLTGGLGQKHDEVLGDTADTTAGPDGLGWHIGSRGKSRISRCKSTMHETARAAEVLQPSASESAVILGWCVDQLAPWLLHAPLSDTAIAEQKRLNETSPNIFLISIEDGQVSVAEKPAEMTLPQIVLDRISLYHNFFQAVTKEHCLDISTTFVLDVGDGSMESGTVPVFSFQKPEGSCSVLIPDIDFLGQMFYEGDEFQDRKDYYEKSLSATFVGSTTGAFYTAEAVRALAPPRLRAAAYFRNKTGVDFLLPNLAQCDSPETEALLRSMGFGDGRRVRWREQFRHRFVISMDGNGATCSRVVVALKSNSALVKYTSPHMLYYFSQLVPWFHYIPVAKDGDVERVLEMEREYPGLFEPIARQGRVFAERYLTKSAVFRYAAELLRMYAKSGRQTSQPRGVVAAGQIAESESGPIPVDYLAHVHNRGDVWSDATGWAGVLGSKLHVEGVLILPATGISPRDLEYQVVAEGGAESTWVSSGEFCGSTGASLPIVGLRVRLLRASNEGFLVSYTATFVDGSRCGPVAGGDLCCSAALAPIEAFHVTISANP